MYTKGTWIFRILHRRKHFEVSTTLFPDALMIVSMIALIRQKNHIIIVKNKRPRCCFRWIEQHRRPGHSYDPPLSSSYLTPEVRDRKGWEWVEWGRGEDRSERYEVKIVKWLKGIERDWKGVIKGIRRSWKGSREKEGVRKFQVSDRRTEKRIQRWRDKVHICEVVAFGYWIFRNRVHFTKIRRMRKRGKMRNESKRYKEELAGKGEE